MKFRIMKKKWDHFNGNEAGRYIVVDIDQYTSALREGHKKLDWRNIKRANTYHWKTKLRTKRDSEDIKLSYKWMLEEKKRIKRIEKMAKQNERQRRDITMMDEYDFPDPYVYRSINHI